VMLLIGLLTNCEESRSRGQRGEREEREEGEGEEKEQMGANRKQANKMKFKAQTNQPGNKIKKVS
jgi:hypothetical protein